MDVAHPHVSSAAVRGAAPRDGENDIQDHRKKAAGDWGCWLGEQVRDGDSEQSQRDQAETHGNLHAANVKIQRTRELALTWLGVAQHEYGQAIHRETPDHAEGVQVRKERNVASADQDGKDLQADDDIDDAIAGAKARMWL